MLSARIADSSAGGDHGCEQRTTAKNVSKLFEIAADAIRK
jgi:hypothetical protein